MRSKNNFSLIIISFLFLGNCNNPKNNSQMKSKNKSTDIIKLAIKRMIPSGPLGYKQLSNCKIFSDSNHLHDAQNPKIIDISKFNEKNIAR